MQLIDLFAAYFALVIVQADPSGEACTALHHARQVVAVGQDAIDSTSPEAFQDKILELDGELDMLVASAMLPEAAEEDVQRRSLRIFRFVSHHQDAVRMARTGNTRTARTLLSETNRGLIDNDLRSMQDFWGCQKETGKVQAEEEREKELKPTPPPLADARDAGPGLGAQPTNSEGHDVAIETDKSGGGGVGGGISEEVQEKLQVVGLLLTILAVLGIYSAHQTSRRIRAVRYPCRIDTTTQYGPHLIGAVIHNIATNGAMLTLNTPLEKDEMIDLMLIGKWHRAKIIWSSGNDVGIKFRPSIRERHVKEILTVALEDQKEGRLSLMSALS